MHGAAAVPAPAAGAGWRRVAAARSAGVRRLRRDARSERAEVAAPPPKKLAIRWHEPEVLGKQPSTRIPGRPTAMGAAPSGAPSAPPPQPQQPAVQLPPQLYHHLVQLQQLQGLPTIGDALKLHQHLLELKQQQDMQQLQVCSAPSSSSSSSSRRCASRTTARRSRDASRAADQPVVRPRLVRRRRRTATHRPDEIAADAADHGSVRAAWRHAAPPLPQHRRERRRARANLQPDGARRPSRPILRVGRAQAEPLGVQPLPRAQAALHHAAVRLVPALHRQGAPVHPARRPQARPPALRGGQPRGRRRGRRRRPRPPDGGRPPRHGGRTRTRRTRRRQPRPNLLPHLRPRHRSG